MSGSYDFTNHRGRASRFSGQNSEKNKIFAPEIVFNFCDISILNGPLVLLQALYFVCWLTAFGDTTARWLKIHKFRPKVTKKTEKCSFWPIIRRAFDQKKTQWSQKYKPAYTAEWPCLIEGRQSAWHGLYAVCNLEFSVSHWGKDVCRKQIKSLKHQERSKNKNKISFFQK